MAGRKKAENNPETEKKTTAKPSKSGDIVEYIQENSLDALKARFGIAEEDERIRNGGFELARSGGLFIKPRPENLYQYAASEVNPREDISTDSDSELSKVFESTKSEHDNDNVYFADLEITQPEEKTEEKAAAKPAAKRTKKTAAKASDEAAEENAEVKAEKPAARTKKTAAKVSKEASEENAEVKAEKPAARTKKTSAKTSEEISEEHGEEEKKTTRKRRTTKKITIEEPDSDEEEIQIVRKYNTHTKVIFSDESLDDGIQRNSDSELEDFFTNEEKGRRLKLWSPKKK